MPLLNFGTPPPPNPVALQQQAQVQMAAPNQGDHVFGNIISITQNALMIIIGGGQNWITNRFATQVFTPGNGVHRTKSDQLTLTLQLWRGFSSLDLGHAANDPRVARNPLTPEPDNHSAQFGFHSNAYQHQLCELVYLSPANNFRAIGSPTAAAGTAWVNAVMQAYDAMVNHLIDETALMAYAAGQITRNIPPIAQHTPRCPAWAYTHLRMPGLNQTNAARLRCILHSVEWARGRLRMMLENFSHINILWNITADRWESF